jgi:glycoside/pentoside/hexuronide:cation symporter, GPH family
MKISETERSMNPAADNDVQTIQPVATAVTLPPRQLSLAVKLLYGVGSISDAVKSLTFGLFLLFFYTSVKGVPGALVGIATSISLVWDATIDPVVGRLSDRLTLRFGRRHSLMLIGSLLTGVTFAAVFSPPANLGTTGLLIWLIGFNLMLRTAQSLFSVPYWALGAELTNGYDERTSLTGLRTACTLTGTMLAAVASFAVFFPESAPGVNARFQSENYLWMGVAFGALMSVCGLLSTFGTLRERANLPTDATADRRTSFRSDIASALKNRSLVRLTISGGLFFLAAVLNATLAVHYLTYFAGMPGSRDTSAFQAAFYLSAVAGVLVWVRAARRFDKHTVYSFAMAGTAVLMGSAYVLIGKGHLLGTGNVAALISGNALAGFFASAVWVLPPSMLADVLDEHELRDGRSGPGVVFGIYSLALQVSASLALVIGGLLVDRFAGLAPGQAEQSALTAERIGMSYGLLPAGLIVLAVAAIFGYSLDRRRVLEIQQQLRDRKQITTA